MLASGPQALENAVDVLPTGLLVVFSTCSLPDPQYVYYIEFATLMVFPYSLHIGIRQTAQPSFV
jgi:hypothetical protein